MNQNKLLIILNWKLLLYRVYMFNELAKRGYDITIVTPTNDGNNIPIPISFKILELPTIDLGPFVWVKGLKKIQPEEYDSILLMPNFRYINLMKFLLPKFRKKMVLWGHMKGRTSGNRVVHYIRKSLFKHYSLLFYDYGTMKDYLSYGYDSKKLFVANNTQYVDNSKVDLNAAKDSFLFVGRIQERKRIDLALRAFGIFKKQLLKSEVRFVVIGGGDIDYLKRIVDQEQIEDVVFAGAVYDEGELANYFTSAIAYVSPGPVGLGVLHAFAFGVPVITCPSHHHGPEINNCDEHNSIIVEDTPEAIADAMYTLYTDEKLRKEMSVYAYDYYNKYCTLDLMIDNMDKAIKSVMV